MSSVTRGFLAEWDPKQPAVDVIPGYYVGEREARDEEERNLRPIAVWKERDEARQATFQPSR